MISGSVRKVQGDDFVSKWASCREANQCSSASMSFPLFMFIFSKLLFILLLQTERMRIYRSQWVWGADFSGPCRSRGSRASPFLGGVGRRIELSQSKESPHFPGTGKWQPLVMHLPWETYAFFRNHQIPTQGCLWLDKKC